MESLVDRLRKRAEIRRSIPRGELDRISDILEEAANKHKYMEVQILKLCKIIQGEYPDEDERYLIAERIRKEYDNIL